jgi:hypothetical protein
MIFSPEEKGLMNFSIQTDGKQQVGANGQPFYQPKQYDIMTLQMALDCRKKVIEGSSEDGKLSEGEVDFSTAEKSFLIKILNREWTINDGELALRLIEKLK